MILDSRKEVLDTVVVELARRVKKGDKIRLNFICTHNSRRSHLSQIWAQAAAYENGFDQVECYSGGTEATAVFPMVIDTLRGQGLDIIALSKGENPIYSIRTDPSSQPLIAFSKRYDHGFNPSSDYIAIMTCGHADENCPIVVGASKRYAVTYVDPKVSDGTDAAEATYLERSEQIRAEMSYIFSNLKNGK